jgi:hypothetical protein
MVGFLMLVGPGEAEMALDNLSHALRLYPDSCACVRDDATQDGTFRALQSFAEEYPGRVCLSRNETPLGYFGCGVSMFRCYEHIARAHPDCEIWIKLDPDACILRCGLDDLARRKFAEFGPGMLGSYRIGPSGAIRGHSVHAKSIAQDFLLLGRDSATGRLRFGRPFYAPYFLRALFHGYMPGHSALGGAYILHRSTVYKLHESGFLRSIPDDASCHTKLEDVLVSMGVKAIGHALIDINNPASGRLETWLQYAPPFPFAADEVIAKRYLVIHPVKNTREGNALRRELRRLLALEPPS